jgi:hypothetical protein
MRPNPITGLISGAIYGQDQILCGNVNSTQWLVTEYKASNQVGGQPQYYCLISDQIFGFGASVFAFMAHIRSTVSKSSCRTVARPMRHQSGTDAALHRNPPPPGFVQLFGNAIGNQTWTQPSGTVATFIGQFNFSQAIVTGLGTVFANEWGHQKQYQVCAGPTKSSVVTSTRHSGS